MKNVKKLIISIWILMGICLLPNVTHAQVSLSQQFPYEWIEIAPWTVDTSFSNILSEWIDDSENWIKRLLQLFMPNSAMYDNWAWPSLLFYLKTVVNLLLSFVSLIALILVIYAFYMIFFKKDEAGITTAKQVIKWVVIALFVIWLSRIVVSFLFRFEKENTQNVWYHDNTEIVTSLT